MAVDHRGRQVTAQPEATAHSERVLVVAGSVILTQAGLFSLFDRSQMMRVIYPLLTRARSLGFWQTEWALLRDRHPVALLPLLVLIPILLQIGVLVTVF